MPKDLFSRYVWIIDTIRRHGSISRALLDEKWAKTRFSEGRPLSRRTFYNYRQAIEDLFQITVAYDPVTNEYSIENPGPNAESITDWLLNSAAMHSVIRGSHDVADRIFLEEVPSAHRFLDTVIDAMRGNHILCISYHPYTRSKPTTGILLDPYFLKIFRQRWYVTGYNHSDRRIKTYALDRITEASIGKDTFTVPDDFSPSDYFRDSFGIVFDEGQPYDVRIRVDAPKAKYIRALPLHHSQREIVHDGYSIFSYRLKLTRDLVEELLSHGPSLTVLSPPELRAMMVTSLSASLDAYTADNH